VTAHPAVWLHLLAAEIAVSAKFLATLDVQLRDHARQLIGVDEIAKGDYALVPPDDGFAVQFRSHGAAVVGAIDGYLVDPSAFGHPVSIGWQARGAAGGQAVRPDEDRDDIEAFWIEFPVAALTAGTRVDTTAIAGAITAPFPIAWDVHRWDSVWLAIHAVRALTTGDVDALNLTLANAIDDYVAKPVIASDATTIEWYLDLGGAGADSLSAAIDRLGALPIASAIDRCTVGRRRAT
jgi:hypothetical protein